MKNILSGCLLAVQHIWNFAPSLNRQNRTNWRNTLLMGTFMTLAACSGNGTWDEQIQLTDGRTITIEQWRRYDSAYDGDKLAKLQREARIRFKAPELGTETIEWKERLTPLVLNVYQGKWYIVGFPPTGAEFDHYKWPRHTYVPFRYDNGKWQRIPFKELPRELYQTNLWLGNNPPEKSPATQADRDAYVVRLGSQLSAELLRVNPTYESVSVQNAIQSNWPVSE